jgi:hypothetical protein
MSVPAIQPSGPALVPALHEVLTGEMANRYGPLPVVPLPAEDELLIGFVHALGSHLRGKGIFRRDYVVVVPDEEKRRIRSISSDFFCSWSQQYVVTSKTKHDANGQPYTVYKDMPGEVAKKVLDSKFIRPYLDEIEEVREVPLPRADGSALLEPGFTDGTFTFAFE